MLFPAEIDPWQSLEIITAIIGILKSTVRVMMIETASSSAARSEGTDTRMRPTTNSRRLGQRLRDWREHRGLDQAGTASAVGVKQPQLSAIENGRAQVDADRLAAFAAALELPDDTLAQLERLRSAAKHQNQSWIQDYGDLLADPARALIELEEQASWVRTHENSLVPAMLQTRAYASRVIAAYSPHVNVHDLQRYVDLRMQRQQRLDRGLRMTATLSEQVVRQQVGGPGVLAEQLDHLLHATEAYDVTIRVVPFAADAHAGMTDQFVIIRWPDDEGQHTEAVYVDGETSWALHESPRLVSQYTQAFDSALARALPPDESIGLIQHQRKELP